MGQICPVNADAEPADRKSRPCPDLPRNHASDRKDTMRLLRVLALFLVGCGLFVQSSAYAVARPVAPVSMEAHCQDMMMQEAGVAASDGDEGRCKEMRLDCLIVMNCIAPLFASDEVDPMLPAASGEHAYAPWRAAVWLGTSRGPEPPPPQLRF